jgi:methyltransferase (TIGR00027 family)
MKEGRASRTAEYMALFRALEATRSAGRRVFEDRFAAAFLSPQLRLVVGLSRVPGVGALVRAYIDRRWPGARTSAVARTRFIDDAAKEALGSGIEQVIILGAGFDARAYRIAAMARGAVVSFLAQRGLVLSWDVGASDYRALYFGRAAMRMRGYEFYRIAVARVPDK